MSKDLRGFLITFMVGDLLVIPCRHLYSGRVPGLGLGLIC